MCGTCKSFVGSAAEAVVAWVCAEFGGKWPAWLAHQGAEGALDVMNSVIFDDRESVKAWLGKLVLVSSGRAEKVFSVNLELRSINEFLARNDCGFDVRAFGGEHLTFKTRAWVYQGCATKPEGWVDPSTAVAGCVEAPAGWYPEYNETVAAMCAMAVEEEMAAIAAKEQALAEAARLRAVAAQEKRMRRCMRKAAYGAAEEAKRIEAARVEQAARVAAAPVNYYKKLYLRAVKRMASICRRRNASTPSVPRMSEEKQETNLTVRLTGTYRWYKVCFERWSHLRVSYVVDHVLTGIPVPVTATQWECVWRAEEARNQTHERIKYRNSLHDHISQDGTGRKSFVNPGLALKRNFDRSTAMGKTDPGPVFAGHCYERNEVDLFNFDKVCTMLNEVSSYADCCTLVDAERDFYAGQLAKEASLASELASLKAKVLAQQRTLNDMGTKLAVYRDDVRPTESVRLSAEQIDSLMALWASMMYARTEDSSKIAFVLKHFKSFGVVDDASARNVDVESHSDKWPAPKGLVYFKKLDSFLTLTSPITSTTSAVTVLNEIVGVDHPLHSFCRGFVDNKSHCGDFISFFENSECRQCGEIHDKLISNGNVIIPEGIKPGYFSAFRRTDTSFGWDDFKYYVARRQRNLTVTGSSRHRTLYSRYCDETQNGSDFYIGGQFEHDVATDSVKDSVVCLAIQNGTILLGRRGPNTSRSEWVGLYAAPGGKVDIGEENRAALERELYEETGLTLLSANAIDRVQDGEFRITFYRCDVEGVPIAKEASSGKIIGDWEWCSKVAAESMPLVPGLIEQIRKLGDNFELGRNAYIEAGRPMPEGWLKRAVVPPNGYTLVNINNKDNLCTLHALNALLPEDERIDVTPYQRGELTIPREGLRVTDFVPRESVSIWQDGEWVVGTGGTAINLMRSRLDDGFGHFDALATPEQLARLVGDAGSFSMYTNGKSSAVGVFDASLYSRQIMTFGDTELVQLSASKQIDVEVLGDPTELFTNVENRTGMSLTTNNASAAAIANVLLPDSTNEEGTRLKMSVTALTAVLDVSLETVEGEVRGATYFDMSNIGMGNMTGVNAHREYDVTSSMRAGVNAGKWTESIKQASCMFPSTVVGGNSFISHFANTLALNDDCDADAMVHFYTRLLVGKTATSITGLVDINNAQVRGNVAYGNNNIHNRGTGVIWPAAANYRSYFAPDAALAGAAQAWFGAAATWPANEFPNINSGDKGSLWVEGGACGSDKFSNFNCHLLPLRKPANVVIPAGTLSAPAARNCFVVLANVFRAGLGFNTNNALIDGVGNFLTTSMPLGKPPIILTPAPMPAACADPHFTSAVYLNPGSWDDAIAFMLANFGYEQAFYAALNNVKDMFRFLSPAATNLGTMPQDRFVDGGIIYEHFIGRLALMHARRPDDITTNANDGVSSRVMKFLVPTASPYLGTSNNANLPRHNDTENIVNRLISRHNGNRATLAQLTPVILNDQNAMSAQMAASWFQRAASINFGDLPITNDRDADRRAFMCSQTVVDFFSRLTTLEYTNMRAWLAGNNFALWTAGLGVDAARLDFNGIAGQIWNVGNIPAQNHREHHMMFARVDRRSSLSMFNLEWDERVQYPCGITLTRNQIEGRSIMPSNAEAVMLAGIVMSSRPAQYLTAMFALAAQTRVVTDTIAYSYQFADCNFQASLGNVITGNSAFDNMVLNGTYSLPAINSEAYFTSFVDEVCGASKALGICNDKLARTESRGQDAITWHWPYNNKFFCTDSLPWSAENRQLCMRVHHSVVAEALIGARTLPGGALNREFKKFTASFPGQETIMAKYGVDVSKMSLAQVVSYLRMAFMSEDERMLFEMSLTASTPAGRKQKTVEYSFFDHYRRSAPRRSDCLPGALHASEDFLNYVCSRLPFRFNFGEVINGDEYLFGATMTDSRSALWCMGAMAAVNAEHDAAFAVDPRNNGRRGTPILEDMWMRQAGVRSLGGDRGAAWYLPSSELFSRSNAPGQAIVYGDTLTTYGRRQLAMFNVMKSGGSASDMLVHSGGTWRAEANQRVYVPGGAASRLGVALAANTSMAVSGPWLLSTPYMNRVTNDRANKTVESFTNRQGNLSLRFKKRNFTMAVKALPVWLGSEIKKPEVLDPAGLRSLQMGRLTAPGVTSALPGVGTFGNRFNALSPPAATDRQTWSAATRTDLQPLPIQTMLHALNARKKDEEEAVALKTARLEAAKVAEEKVMARVTGVIVETKAAAELQALNAAKAEAALKLATQQLEKIQKQLEQREKEVALLTDKVEKERAAEEKKSEN